MKNKTLKIFLLLILKTSIFCKDKSFDFLKFKDDNNEISEEKKKHIYKFPILPFLNNQGNLGVQKENPGIKKNNSNKENKNSNNPYSSFDKTSKNFNFEDLFGDDFNFDELF